MTIINAFHPDYVKTHMPEMMTKIQSEEKAKNNGKLYGAKTRLRESIPQLPDRNTIGSFPKTKKAGT